MEREIGKPIGYVDKSRRPYAAFVLSNPELIKGIDLATYAGQLSIYHAEPGKFKPNYDILTKNLSTLVRTLPEKGPRLEDADIIDYSGFSGLSYDAFEEMKPQSQDWRIRTAFGPTPPDQEIFEIMTYLHFLRDVSEKESDKVIKTAGIGELYDGEAWKQLGTEDLRKVVERGKSWGEQEYSKYLAIQRLEKEVKSSGQRMPEGIELGRMLEEKLGLDYGGYDWNSFKSKIAPRFNDGTQVVNVIVGKANLIGDLQNELDRRK